MSLLRLGALAFLLLIFGCALVLWLRSLGMWAHDQYIGAYRMRIPYGWEIISASPSGFYAHDLLRLWKGSDLAVMVIPKDTGTESRKFPAMCFFDPHKIYPIGKIEIDGIPFEKVYWSQQIPTSQQLRQMYGGMIKESWPSMPSGVDGTVAFEYRGAKDGKEIDFIGHSSDRSEFLGLDTTKTNWDELHNVEKIVLSFKRK